MVPENCNGHDDVMRAISKYEAQMAACSVKMDTVIKQSEQSAVVQREIKKCLNSLTLDLAKNYVTKQEFKDFIDNSEDRIIKVHERLDQAHRDLNGLLVKLLLLGVPLAALVWQVLRWIVDMIWGIGVM